MKPESVSGGSARPSAGAFSAREEEPGFAKPAQTPFSRTVSRLGRSVLGATSAGRTGALGRFFDLIRRRESDSASPVAAAGRGAGLRHAEGLQAAPEEASFSPAGDYARYKQLRQVLGDGTRSGEGLIQPFSFRTPSGDWVKARSAGLEGFFYSKLEHERAWGAANSAGQVDDYFKYIDALLAPMDWALDIRREYRSLRHIAAEPEAKNALLNEQLVKTVAFLQKELSARDPSAWGRAANTYVILARAYNRLKAGKNFFDSLDEEELARIRRETSADELWLADVFEIGDIRRWGTGGGSPYAIKGYSKIQDGLGGAAAFRRFVARAHAAGFKVRTDFIPNHTSLDSELVEKHPQAFLHILPPQGLSDEEIMAGVPREANAARSPVFYLVKTRNYPGRVGRETKVLLHHPRTDYGDVMWVDMGQIDFSRKEARRWLVDQALDLFENSGLDSVRRDMAYYVLNTGYHERWLRILEDEKNSSGGWARAEMERLIAGFRGRWAALGGAEFLEELSDEVKARRPGAVFHDEAYAYFSDLSRAGSDGVYAKNTHDAAMGQIGLYDALRGRDPALVRAALRNNSFRFWQRGGATVVNFIGNHDEMNPVDLFGKHLRAAAAVALLGGAILTYNGQELGTGQVEMLGELKGSVDRNKAIPFDVPVKIDWERIRPENRDFLRMIWRKRVEYKALFGEGALEVLEPYGGTPVVAYSVSRWTGERQETIIVAANLGDEGAWGHFNLRSAALNVLGGFVPRADRSYLLRDQAHREADGSPKTYAYSGKQLLEQGLFIRLDAGDAHLFELEELAAGDAARAPPAGTNAPARLLASEASSGVDSQEPAKAPEAGARTGLFERLKRLGRMSWNDWTELLTNSAILAFLPLQLPQILKNFGNISSGTLDAISILPWMGYSTGILANMLLLSYFVSQKEKGAARVQGIGVATSAVVVAQIFYAGFMPSFAFWTIVPTIVGGLLLNFLNFNGKVSAGIWRGWNVVTGLAGLVVLPLVFWATFSPFVFAGVGMLPGYLLAGAAGLAGALLMWGEGAGRLPPRLLSFWRNINAWTATGLFMFGPLAQLASNLTNPAQIAGIALATLLLGTAGNLVMLPRAVLNKDRIWFTGSFWAVAVGGWVVLLTMFLHGALAPALFLGFSLALPLFLAFIIRGAMKHHKQSLRAALSFLWTGKRE